MKKCNLKQQAYQIIRRKIINCEYQPGAFINENILLEDVPGSRTPIRDALSRLEQEKLLTVLPKKGILISSLSMGDIKLVYKTRLLLEPFAVLNCGNKLTEDFYIRMYEIFTGSLKDPAFSPEEEARYHEADDEFHLAFIKATDNPYFEQVYEQIHAQTHRVRVLTGNVSSGRLIPSGSEHLEILLSCLKKDWATASLNMRKHLSESQTSVLEQLSNLMV